MLLLQVAGPPALSKDDVLTKDETLTHVQTAGEESAAKKNPLATQAK
jgi:hypothetical protein